MATRVEEILIRARDSLSDPLQERWPDSRLLRLVDEAQQLIAVQAGLLRSKVLLPLVAGQSEYQLPADCHRIHRVVNEAGNAIPLVTHEYADKHYGVLWDTKSFNLVSSVIYDKQNTAWVKTYPIPDGTAANSATSQNTSSFASDFGIVTDVTDYSVIDQFGVVVEASNDFVNVFDPDTNGILANLTEDFSVLTIYYTRKPAAITLATDSLEIDSVFDRAIKFYTVGMALRDDLDAQNRTVGNETLSFFKAEMQTAMKDGAHDSTDSIGQYQAEYQGAF